MDNIQSQTTPDSLLPQPCFATGDGIICAGLPRSGTASLAQALTILGFGPVHHALDIRDKREVYEWGRAAWCNLPHLRKSRPSGPFYISQYESLLPWTRGNWDRLLRRYRVVTDFGSFFTGDLIRAYPEARVIAVERTVDTWMKSVGSTLDTWVFGIRGLVLRTLGPWVGVTGPHILADLTKGFLQAETREEAWKRLPEVHKEHHQMLREMVPKDQLLELKMGDGWEPLCQFLGVPVPAVPFPHSNHQASLTKVHEKSSKGVAVRAGKWLGSLLFILGGVAISMILLR